MRDFERGAVRVDSGVRQGDAISPFYDSMVAKLIVHGDTREQDWRGWTRRWRKPTSSAWPPTCSFAPGGPHRRLPKPSWIRPLIPREEATLFKQESVGLPWPPPPPWRKPCCTSVPAKVQTRSAAAMAGVRTAWWSAASSLILAA